MKVECIWKGHSLFENQIRAHRFLYDVAAPHGEDRGPSPKESLLSAVAGCTGMDVAALAGKYKLPLKDFKISAQAETTQTQPKIFTQIDLIYEAHFEPFDRETHLAKFLEAIDLSMTKYCGVSAMVAPTSPIFYSVVVNGEIEFRGQSSFPTEKR